MSLSERRAMLWQKRIEAFKMSGEKSVAAWCREHQINVNSMYSWLKKDAGQQVKQANSQKSTGFKYILQLKISTFRLPLRLN